MDWRLQAASWCIYYGMTMFIANIEQCNNDNTPDLYYQEFKIDEAISKAKHDF